MYDLSRPFVKTDAGLPVPGPGPGNQGSGYHGLSTNRRSCSTVVSPGAQQPMTRDGSTNVNNSAGSTSAR